MVIVGMRREGRPMVRLAGRLRDARLPAVAAALVVVERALVGEVGSPATLLRALPGHGDAWADPVVPVLALMALVAETLIGYVLVMLVLRWSCGLPGALGRIAGRTELLLTPAMTRRALDLLVGGTLLAQATLAAAPGPPGGHRPDAPSPAFAVSVTHRVRSGPAVGSEATLAESVLEPARHRRPADERAPGPTRPTPRRSAAPLPPWLGGGPSKAASGHTVVAGDTLWDIAAAHLPPAERSVGRVHHYWQQVYRANRRVVGADPDLIHPGTRLDVLPFRSDQ
jgi:resuscitation-promoting factor RpfA